MDFKDHVREHMVGVCEEMMQVIDTLSAHCTAIQAPPYGKMCMAWGQVSQVLEQAVAITDNWLEAYPDATEVANGEAPVTSS